MKKFLYGSFVLFFISITFLKAYAQKSPEQPLMPLSPPDPKKMNKEYYFLMNKVKGPFIIKGHKFPPINIETIPAEIQSENKTGKLPIYKGKWKNGMKNGLGTMYFRQREGVSIYEGEWKDNKKHGYGRLSAPSEIYLGEWENDQKSGTGILIAYTNIYSGQFKEGQRSGYGKIYLAPHYLLAGEWEYGSLTGRGFSMLAPNYFYTGSFVKFKKEGRGRLVWSTPKLKDKGIYEGEFMNDQFSGYGKIKWPDGSVYEGMFKNDKPTEPRKIIYSEAAKHIHKHTYNNSSHKDRTKVSIFSEKIDFLFSFITFHKKTIIIYSVIIFLFFLALGWSKKSNSQSAPKK